MTREELIEGLKLLEDNMVYFDELLNDKGKRIDVHELLFESIEALEQEPCRETDDYENEIEGLQNRLDIAEYDKERLREEVTVLEEKLKALYTEPCDCISRQAVLACKQTFHDNAGYETEYVDIDDIKALPSIQPKTDVLDKIRAEIKEESRFCPLTEGLERALEIIDKYTAEETWEGIHAQVTAPKGTFDKIWNEAEDNDEI